MASPDFEKWVASQLSRTILPNLIAAGDLTGRPIHRVHGVYSFASDFAALAIGAGLSSPFLLVFAGKEQTALETIKQPYLYGVLCIFALVVIATRVYLARTRAAELVPLEVNCKNELQSFYVKLDIALSEPDPRAKLKEIKTAISEVVQRNVQQGSFPYRPLPSKFHQEAAKQTKVYVEQFRDFWGEIDGERAETPSPTPERREPPATGGPG